MRILNPRHPWRQVQGRGDANLNRQSPIAVNNWPKRYLSEGAWLDIGAEVIVLGDLNDGPGLDVYEELFSRSSVEIIMGQSQGPEKQLFDPHAMQMIEKTG